MPFTDTDLAGRKIDALFVSAPLTLTANTRLFTCNQSPEIAPSGKTAILFVSANFSAGADTGSSSIAFGSSLGASDWSNGGAGPFVIASFTDRPLMFYPYYASAGRPGVYANGTGFYLTIGNAFAANATCVFTLYGFTY